MDKRTDRRSRFIATDDIKNQSAMSLEEAARRFIEDRHIMNLTEYTIKYYTMELRMAIRYLAAGNIHTLEGVTKDHIRTLIIRYMQQEGNKETSINARLRAIRAFFIYCVQEGYITSNPMEGISLLKTRKNSVEAFNIEQVKAILSMNDKRTFAGLRDYTMILLMLETGVRLSETIGIELSDVNIKDGYVRIRNAKNHEERNVPIQTEVRKALTTYIRTRGELEHQALFVNVDNGVMSRRGFQDRLKMLGQKAGIKNVRCSPHTLRHTFAKLAVQGGANLFELQYILGHKSLDMVRIYVNLFSTEVADGHKRFSPVSKLMR